MNVGLSQGAPTYPTKIETNGHHLKRIEEAVELKPLKNKVKL